MDKPQEPPQQGIHIAPEQTHSHEEFLAFYYAQRDEVEREWQQFRATLPSDYFDIEDEDK